MITYSSCGRVFIAGEYAASYGKPTLVSAIGKRLSFSVWEEKTHSHAPFVTAIIHTIRSYFQKHAIPFEDKQFNYRIQSDIPQRGDFGASSALHVSSTAAFFEFFTGKPCEKELINTLAFQADKHALSGVDTSASCFGGLLYYRKEFEFLKSISLLHIKIPKKIEQHLYILTRNVVTRAGDSPIENLFNRHPKRIETVLQHMEKITKRIIIALIREDAEDFKASLKEHEKLTEKLSLVDRKTKQLLTMLHRFGKGKVFQGDGILFYADNPLTFEEFCLKKNLDYFKFIYSSIGLQRE